MVFHIIVPTYLPSYLPSILPSYLPSYLPTCHLSYHRTYHLPYHPTYLTYPPLPTYLYLPTSTYLPLPTYLHLPTTPYLPLPTYLYLPISTYLPLPTYLPSYQPIYLLQFLSPLLQEGFNECAVETCHFLETCPDLDSGLLERLGDHLEACTGPLSIQVPSYRLTFSPAFSPESIGFTPKPKHPVLDVNCSSAGLLMQSKKRGSVSCSSIPKRSRKTSISSSTNSDSSESMWRPW